MTTHELPIFYYLNANQVRELGESFLKAASGCNVTLRPCNLLTQEGVPEDAAGILLADPQVDYSQEEREKIYQYLEGGGSALIFTDFSLDPFPGL